MERQVTIAFEYDGLLFDGGLTVDLLVNRCVVVEIKAVERTHPVHARQTFTYVRLLGLQVGLLLNFGAATMKEGIRRIVHGYRPSPQTRIRIEAEAPRSEEHEPPS